MEPTDGVVIVAAFRTADLRRLHGLLCAYESPFSSPAEVSERVRDKQEHERLRRRIALLLTDYLNGVRNDSREWDGELMGNDA